MALSSRGGGLLLHPAAARGLFAAVLSGGPGPAAHPLRLLYEAEAQSSHVDAPARFVLSSLLEGGAAEELDLDLALALHADADANTDADTDAAPRFLGGALQRRRRFLAGVREIAVPDLTRLAYAHAEPRLVFAALHNRRGRQRILAALYLNQAGRLLHCDTTLNVRDLIDGFENASDVPLVNGLAALLMMLIIPARPPQLFLPRTNAAPLYADAWLLPALGHPALSPPVWMIRVPDPYYIPSFQSRFAPPLIHEDGQPEHHVMPGTMSRIRESFGGDAVGEGLESDDDSNHHDDSHNTIDDDNDDDNDDFQSCDYGSEEDEEMEKLAENARTSSGQDLPTVVNNTIAKLRVGKGFISDNERLQQKMVILAGEIYSRAPPTAQKQIDILISKTKNSQALPQDRLHNKRRMLWSAIWSAIGSAVAHLSLYFLSKHLKEPPEKCAEGAITKKRSVKKKLLAWSIENVLAPGILFFGVWSLRAHAIEHEREFLVYTNNESVNFFINSFAKILFFAIKEYPLLTNPLFWSHLSTFLVDLFGICFLLYKRGYWDPDVPDV